MTRIRILLLAALVCGALQTAAQGFFNLTASQVRIDSLLPQFNYIHELGSNFEDSVYEVSIDYPEFIDMGSADIRRYKAITSDSLPELPIIYTARSISRKQGFLNVAFVPLVFREGKFRKLVSFKLTVKSRPRASLLNGKAAVAKAPGERYTSNSVLAGGSWAKIRVSHSGVFHLSDDLIYQAGFTNPSKVKVYGYGGALQPESLTDAYLRATDDLKEVPTCYIGGKRLFFAQGPVSWTADGGRIRNPYSTHGYYFLTESDAAPRVVDENTFIAGFYPAGCDYNALYEVESYAWYKGGRNLYDAETFSTGTTRTYSVAACSSGAGKLTVAISGDAATTAEVRLNGVTVGNVTITRIPENSVANSATKTFTVSNLAPVNTVSIRQTNGSTMRLDYISTHSNSPRPSSYVYSGTYDVPEFVYRITNQNHHADTPVDMIILIPTTQRLRAYAEKLKTLHEQLDGMSVRIVPADELYNEFSSGTPDATAYRRYLKMFYDRAKTDAEIPRYLLLFGDGAWDNRMLCQQWKGLSPDDFLLCFESENSFSETECYVSDDFFCMLDDEEQIQQPQDGRTVYLGRADVAAGRLPVRTESDAKTVVDKITAYVGNKNAGAWQNTIVMMGDDGNNNIHMIAADNVAKLIERKYPSFDVKRVMWDAYAMTTSATGSTYPEVEQLLKQYMTNGALVMNYSGHGSPTQISHEKALMINDFRNNVTQHLPLWVTASCDIMPFDGQEENIGETAMFNAKGGAVAFFGTTRTVYSGYNEKMNLAFTEYVLATDGGQNSIGEAVRLAKNSLVDLNISDPRHVAGDNTNNKLQYTLLGDPALRLALPRLDAVIDDINGNALGGEEHVTLKAGMEVTVNGHIENNGTRADDFNGEITGLVRDASQTIECRLNNTSSDGAQVRFVYTDRPSTIFKGNDNVTNGTFSFKFVVPKDISYSDATGKIIVYAMNADRSRTAAGSTDDVLFNGSIDFSRDSIGPSIYCYLNTASFSNGDNVNTTPYFVAEINDDYGINATGSGIGHDLQLVIDGEMARTYVLNDYFAFDFGTYKSGRLGFSIPRLNPGEHKLKFKAWDVLNYSSTAELSFNVVEGLSPDIIDIDCFPNPASTYTTFRVTHDRIGSDVGVVLDIFDMSGRHLWSQTESAVPTGNTLSFDWDLTVGNGRRLGTGVYLYRVRLNCEGGSYVSKAKKLIIMCNK